VWRLKKIGKSGVFHKALEANGISSVEDLMRLYYKDEKALHNVRKQSCSYLFSWFDLDQANFLYMYRFSVMPHRLPGKLLLIMLRSAILGDPFTLTLLKTRTLGCTSVLWVRLLEQQ